MIVYLWLSLLPAALSAVVAQKSIDPKVSKAVDSILLVVQNELHHVVNEAVFSVAKNDQDLITEIKDRKEEMQKEMMENEKDQTDSDESKSSLDKRWWGGYGYGYPYYGYGMGGWDGMYGGWDDMYGGMYGGWPYGGGWGGWYFKVRKDIKQNIEGKLVNGFKAVALHVVNGEYTTFLKDNDEETHLDATEERLALAWSKYAAYQKKNTVISKLISSLEEKLSDSTSAVKRKELEAILKSSLVNVTSVFTSDKMDLPLSELYYPSELADEVDYV